MATAVLTAVTVSAGAHSWARLRHLRVRGQDAVLIRPHHPSDRVVVYVHGAGGDAMSIATDMHLRPVMRALLRHGYWIASSAARGDNWGSPASVRDYVALVRRLRRQGLRRVYVLSESMGGLDGMLLLDHVRVRAWAGIFPLCNLRSVYHRRHAALKRSIRAAYGVKTLGQLKAREASRIPVTPRRVAGLPMIFWASPGDHVVPMRSNTDRCAAAARARGARVTVVRTHGDHGDRANFEGRRLAAFFSAAG